MLVVLILKINLKITRRLLLELLFLKMRMDKALKILKNLMIGRFVLVSHIIMLVNLISTVTTNSLNMKVSTILFLRLMKLSSTPRI